MHGLTTIERVFRHAHVCCGVGACAKGFNGANPRIGHLVGRFECAGGIDVDPGALANFERLTGAKGTLLDLFEREQYTAFHDRAPPAGWHEATPADFRAAFGPTPDVVFASMPCKGFSGLLSARKSETAKYQALNGLTLRGMFLLLEAYRDDPVPIILFENVPRIGTRGRWLLDQIIAMFRGFGYFSNEGVHDCGKIGNLAQSRDRRLVIFRHAEKVPPFVYEPPQRRLRGVGEVIGKLPLPGDPVGGAMHRIPALQWKTWVRLAFVEAGKDWRSLNRLRVEDGMLADFGLVPEFEPGREWRDGVLGVNRWTDTAGTVIGNQRSPLHGWHSVADPRPNDMMSGGLGVLPFDGAAGALGGESHPTNGRYAVADPRVETDFATNSGEGSGRLGVRGWDESAGSVAGASRPENGAYSVADPRVDGHPKSVQLGVRPWDATAPCVKGDMSVGTGPYAVADPRLHGRPRFNNVFRIVRYDDPSPTVAGPGGPAGGLAVADPRTGFGPNSHYNKLKVVRHDEASPTVTGSDRVGSGALSVADPRPSYSPDTHKNVFRVTDYDEPAGTVTSGHSPTNGAISVADPRPVAFRDGREHFEGGGHYGVIGWREPAGTVSGSASYDNGRNSIADPRDVDLEPVPFELPKPKQPIVCRIIAEDGTWHRPFTTLDLAALQSIVQPEEVFSFDPETGQWVVSAEFELAATSDAMKREWIGNAVPSAAAQAMAETIGEALLLASIGETFTLSTRQLWVKPLALAFAIDTDQVAFRMERES